MILAKLLIVLALGLSNVLGEYTEQDVKNMKMIFCGMCKDEAVRKDLQAYSQCCKDKMPDITDKVMAIRTAIPDKPDQCFAQVMAIMKEYAKNNPDAKKVGEDCFHSNVNKDHLVNCH